MWDLPGPGIKPVSPALAGGFLTTAPPGKSCPFNTEWVLTKLSVCAGRASPPAPPRPKGHLVGPQPAEQVCQSHLHSAHPTRFTVEKGGAWPPAQADRQLQSLTWQDHQELSQGIASSVGNQPEDGDPGLAPPNPPWWGVLSGPHVV